MMIVRSALVAVVWLVIGRIAFATESFVCEDGELVRLATDPPLPQFRGGQVVSISGDVAFVGLPMGLGKVHVFRRDNDVWREEATLTYPGVDGGSFFGSSVSVYRDTAVVGAPRDRVNEIQAGSAFVYRFDGKTWILEARLRAPNPERGDVFGTSVAIHEDLVVVGASQQQLPGQAGKAHVYRRTEGRWREQAELKASDGGSLDEFGNAVAAGTDVIVVGALNHGNSGRRDFRDGTGAAYVFHYDARRRIWEERAKLVSRPLPGQRDRFGRSVSLHGDSIAVGTDPISFGGPSPGGSAYVFRSNEGRWSEEAKLVSSDVAGGDRFGAAVSISGDILVVGAWGEWPGHCPFPRTCHAGAAYVFRRDGADWIEEAKVASSDLQENDLFGWTASVDGSTAVIGTQRDNAVFVFGGLSDCNGNDALDLCDIASNTSRDDNRNGVPDECDCTGREKIKTRCTSGRGSNKVKVTALKGNPIDTVELCLDDGMCVEGGIDRRGRSKTKWKGVPSGPHVVSASWRCGARSSGGAECP